MTGFRKANFCRNIDLVLIVDDVVDNTGQSSISFMISLYFYIFCLIGEGFYNSNHDAQQNVGETDLKLSYYGPFHNMSYQLFLINQSTQWFCTIAWHLNGRPLNT